MLLTSSRNKSALAVDERVVEFVSRKIGHAIYPPFTAIGLERGGKIVAGVVFNCFTGPNVEATVAADHGALSVALIRACGRYAFGQLGCERVTFTTESRKVVSLAQRLNARVEGSLRSYFGRGRDGIVLGLLREDWKV
jgi:hypothetical protein